MFLCSLNEELCTKEGSKTTGCSFNFEHQCTFNENNSCEKMFVYLLICIPKTIFSITMNAKRSMLGQL